MTFAPKTYSLTYYNYTPGLSYGISDQSCESTHLINYVGGGPGTPTLECFSKSTLTSTLNTLQTLPSYTARGNFYGIFGGACVLEDTSPTAKIFCSYILPEKYLTLQINNTTGNSIAFSEVSQTVPVYKRWTPKQRSLTTSDGNIAGSVVCSSDGTIVMYPRSTMVVKSINSGETWTDISTPVAFNTICCSADAQKLLAARQGGYLYTSIDGGVNWTQLTAQGSRTWSSVACSSDGMTLIALDWNNGVYRSLDGGANWTLVLYVASHTTRYGCCSSDGTHMVVTLGLFGNYDKVYASTDSGTTWAQRPAGAHVYSSVKCSADGLKVILASPGYLNNDVGVYTSTDQCLTVTQRLVAIKPGAVAVSPDGLKFVVGPSESPNRQTYMSYDGGVTWTTQGSLSDPQTEYGYFRDFVGSGDFSKIYGCHGSWGIVRFDELPTGFTGQYIDGYNGEAFFQDGYIWTLPFCGTFIRKYDPISGLLLNSYPLPFDVDGYYDGAIYGQYWNQKNIRGSLAGTADATNHYIWISNKNKSNDFYQLNTLNGDITTYSNPDSGRKYGVGTIAGNYIWFPYLNYATGDAIPNRFLRIDRNTNIINIVTIPINSPANTVNWSNVRFQAGVYTNSEILFTTANTTSLGAVVHFNLTSFSIDDVETASGAWRSATRLFLQPDGTILGTGSYSPSGFGISRGFVNINRYSTKSLRIYTQPRSLFGQITGSCCIRYSSVDYLFVYNDTLKCLYKINLQTYTCSQYFLSNIEVDAYNDIVAVGNYIVFVPYNSQNIAKYSIVDNSISYIPHSCGTRAFKGGAAYSTTQAILAPYDSSNILIFTVATNIVTLVPHGLTGSELFNGCSYDTDGGNIIFAPFNSTKFIRLNAYSGTLDSVQINNTYGQFKGCVNKRYIPYNHNKLVYISSWAASPTIVVTNAAVTSLQSAGLSSTSSGSRIITGKTDSNNKLYQYDQSSLAWGIEFDDAIVFSKSITKVYPFQGYTFFVSGDEILKVIYERVAYLQGTPPGFSLSGTIQNDGVGLAGVTVTLTGESTATVITDSLGQYRFNCLVVGNYTVTPTFGVYVFDPISQNISITTSSVIDVNFRVPQPTYISGFLSEGGVFQQNKTISLANLNLDTTGFNGQVTAIVTDGTYIYVGGAFTTYKGITTGQIAKIDKSTGNLVSGFSTGSGFSGLGSDVRALAISGNSLYAGGYYTSYNGTTRQSIAKLDATTGALDLTFDSESGAGGASATVTNIIIDGNSLFVAGALTTYKGITRNRICKINATTAALDATFDPAAGFGGVVQILYLNGNNLYCGGDFTSYRGTTRQYVAKLDATTAALDATFDTATGFNSRLRALTFDGTYLYCGGQFTSYKGTTRQYIAKIDATTAALDTTFDTTVGFNGVVRGSLILYNNDLYCGGEFTTYKGTNTRGVAKIDKTTAIRDTTFDTTTGLTGGVVLDLIKDNNNLYVVGLFTLYGTIARPRFAILNASHGALDGFLQRTALTDVNGFYIFNDLDSATHLLKPPANAYSYTPNHINVVILHNYSENNNFS